MSNVPGVVTRGVVFVHSAPIPLCPHVQWALEHALGHDVQLDWRPQPAGHRMVRSELSWTGPVGTGAVIASALRGWDEVRYEVTEEPTVGSEGCRWQHTPTLGIHYAPMSTTGDAMIAEDRIKAALEQSVGDAASLVRRLEDLLGTAWDAELDTFRYAGDGALVRWLHRAV